uniref:NACHT domain-containing protein n=1 Tax=Parastrongyloides trichosuri TaxID=131310 RepID=A0A0N4ZF20_PARTI
MLLYIFVVATFTFTLQSCAPRKKKNVTGFYGTDRLNVKKTSRTKFDDKKDMTSLIGKKNALTQSKVKEICDLKKQQSKNEDKKDPKLNVDKKNFSLLFEVTALSKTYIAEDVTQRYKGNELEASVKYKKSSDQPKSLESGIKNVKVITREPVSSVRISTETKKYTKKHSTESPFNESIKGESIEHGNSPVIENQIISKTQNDEVPEKNEKDLEKEYLNNKKKVKIEFDPTKLNKEDVYNVGIFKVHKGSDIWACNSLSKSSKGKLSHTTEQDMFLQNIEKANQQTQDETIEDKEIRIIYDKVHKGLFDNIPSPASKIVRVFTSSTFTDTSLERNMLMEEVYPNLKKYCREMHGLDFQVVDMRWGVRDEATDDHMTTKLCLNEIKNCQKISLGPNFVVFLCQKYGYRPIPSEILSTEFEILKKVLKERQDDVSLLDTWYVEDFNAVPSHFTLQQISSILVNFNNKRIPKLQEQDSRAWWNVEAKMQSLLRKGAKICYERGIFNYEEMHNYFMSVTEREVINGILKADDPNEHCLCYIRTIKNINISLTSTASKFIDIVHNEINGEAQNLLASLRDEQVTVKLSSNNIRRSTVEWIGREGLDTTYHSDYLKDFCDDFYHRITGMVKKAVQFHSKYRDPMFVEVLQHLHNGLLDSLMFYGRSDELNKANRYILSDSNSPLIFKGDNGCGKTSLLAKIATEIKDWYKEKNIIPVIILRFLGTSASSSSISPLLTSVCDQIAYNYDKNLINQSPTELSILFQHFKKMMALATRENPLILILDSLDLLSKLDGAHELLWFPTALPLNVKLIVSLNNGPSIIEGSIGRMIEIQSQYVNVPPLGIDLGLEMIEKWLKSIGRTLTKRQWEIVKNALQYCSLPLFVKLIFATVSRWKSHSRAQDTTLFKSVQSSIHSLFDRTESQHGKLLVSHALSYISAARSGLSDSELEDLISLDDKVLDDIYQYHLPPVRRIPPLLWSRIRADLPGYLSERAADDVIVLNWYHEQFRSAATERYFKNLNHLQQTHSAIADYFLGIYGGGVQKPFQFTDLQKQRFGVFEKEGLADRKVPLQPNVFYDKEGKIKRYNTRKLNELPYHFLKASRYQDLMSLCLFNFDFLQAKVASFPLQAVIADYEDAMNKFKSNINEGNGEFIRQLALVADALRLSSSLISRYSYMLAFELLGRLLPLVPNNSLIKDLLIGCDLEATKLNCFIPAHHAFHSPGGPLKYSLEEHPFAVFGLDLVVNRKMLVSISNQLIVWDTESGDLALTINPNIEGIFFGITISHDGKYVAAYTNNNQVVIMGLMTGEYIIIEPEKMVKQMEIIRIQFYSNENNNLLIWSNNQYQIYDINGQNLKTESITRYDGFKLLNMFYMNELNNVFIFWSGDKDDWDVKICSKINGKNIEELQISSALVFFDNKFTSGACCIQKAATTDKNFDSDCDYTVILIKDSGEGRYEFGEIIEDNLEDRPNDIVYWPRPNRKVNGIQVDWICIVMVDGFILHQTHFDKTNSYLKLPSGIRNIPVKPMHTTSVMTFNSNDSIFVAAVRNSLYVWKVDTLTLIRTIDAHFGRILNLRQMIVHSQNLIISSSLDRTIKIWNMENIFEKSFYIFNMDQPVEKIHLASQKGNIAIAQTRKYIGVWDIRNHRFIISLATNPTGAVVTHSLISNDGKTVICIENDNLLVWDLKTQSVKNRTHVPHCYQLMFFNHENMVGVLTKHLDTPEQKICRIVVYKIDDLSLHYTYEWSCRSFKSVVILKDQQTFALIAISKGHDLIQVIDAIEGTIKSKFRPKCSRKMQRDIIVYDLGTIKSNNSLIVVMENDSKGIVWNWKTKKVMRQLLQYSNISTLDGKLGLYAPNKGGLSIIDMKTGSVIKNLIGNVREGVNDIFACFSSSGNHVLYYHTGHQSLRCFRVSDGKLIGTLKPHAKIVDIKSDIKGQQIVIGGLDGSVLVAIICDDLIYPGINKVVASLPSRKHLLNYLGLAVDQTLEDLNLNICDLGAISIAAAKFKSGLKTQKQKGSAVCSIQ